MTFIGCGLWNRRSHASDREIINIFEKSYFDPDNPNGAPNCKYRAGDWVSILTDDDGVCYGRVLATGINDDGEIDVCVREYNRVNDGYHGTEQWIRKLNVDEPDKGNGRRR